MYGYVRHPQLNLEEYLYYHHIAYKRDNLAALNQLDALYPDLLALSIDTKFMAQKGDSADYEYCCPHPIILDSTRMTERRVLDMAAYLLCQDKAPKNYRARLQGVAYRLIFNYETDRFQRDYDFDGLWEHFFLGLPELRWRIELRRITSLTELEYRAAEYFEKCS